MVLSLRWHAAPDSDFVAIGERCDGKFQWRGTNLADGMQNLPLYTLSKVSFHQDNPARAEGGGWYPWRRCGVGECRSDPGKLLKVLAQRSLLHADANTQRGRANERILQVLQVRISMEWQVELAGYLNQYCVSRQSRQLLQIENFNLNTCPTLQSVINLLRKQFL